MAVLLGNDDGTFQAQRTFSTGVGSYPIWVAVGDFNNDTRPDIAVANFGSNTVGVFLGNGNGTFAAQMTFSTGVGSYPISVAVGDFNQDTRADIAVANYGSNTVGIFLGNGDGRLTAQSIFSTGALSAPHAVAVGDFNNDTRLDITVANNGGNNVGVLLGNGDGTFAAQTTFSTGTGSNPTAVAVGDFNKDARLDITVANYGSNNVGVLLGNGDGTFAALVTFSMGALSGPYAMAIGDFNHDTRWDITVANYGGNNVGVLLGNGDGTFQAQTTFSTGMGSSPISVAVGDFNQDTRPDIAVSNNGGSNVGVLLGNGDGTFQAQRT
ncbi:unnamed protein product, partial [Rotaria sp. Silwood1]